MKKFLPPLVAGVLVSLMLAGTEAVVAYPRPSYASGQFFKWAFITYLPFAIVVAISLSATLGRRGLDLWLPLGVAGLRIADGLAAELWTIPSTAVALAAIALGLGFAARWIADRQTGSPPFLFGLTVGVVLPILTARLVMPSLTPRLGTADHALAAGSLLGLFLFTGLRAFVTRWPKVGPVFLLGPIVSLAIWSRSPGVDGNAAVPHRLEGSLGPPDVVLIVLDTVRAQSLATYGYSKNTMPNLDAFARNATVFEKAWTTGSWTLPAHASLFTGMRVGAHHYDSGYPARDRVSPSRFLAARTRDAGYATGAVAANFGVFGREEPLLTGFQDVEVEPLRPYAFKPWFFNLLRWFPHASWLRPQAEAFPGPSLRAPWVVDRALEFWSRNEGRPRFLFVNFMEAHLPWIPDPEDLGKLGPAGLSTEPEQLEVLGRPLKGGHVTPAEADILKARYEESLMSLDRSLGRLLAVVAKSEDTVVVITSDHGESLGEHGRFGHRNSLDEAATRIPLVVRDRRRADRSIAEPILLSRVFNVLCDAAGIENFVPPPPPPGVRAFPLLLEHRPGPQALLPSGYPRGDVTAAIDWPYKLVEGGGISISLFDLSVDPTEVRDLAAMEPERVKAMRDAMRQIPRSPSRSDGLGQPDERLRALGYLR